jgi:hypothetical protein
LQIEQGVLARFRASKVGSEALMQLAQGQRPSSYLLEGWSCFIRWSMLVVLQVFLVSDGYLFKELFVLLECHIEIETCTKCFFVADLWIRLKVPL